MEVAMSQIRGEMANSISVSRSPCMLIILTCVDGWVVVGEGSGVGIAWKMRVVVSSEIAGETDSGVVGESRSVWDRRGIVQNLLVTGSQQMRLSVSLERM